MAARDGEQSKHPAQGEEAATVADTAAAACYFCGGMPAVVYCRADSAGLCLPCDRHVHGANTVSSRHARAPLCAACRTAAASCRRAGRFLCSDCDFEEEEEQRNGAAARGREMEPPLHDRGTVEGYTGCPSVGDLAAILGVVHGCDKAAAADEAWWSVWEEPQVLTLEDVIVPTTSGHGLDPLLTPSSPENRSSPCGELDGEVLRQLGELAKSEAAAQVAVYVEAEPAGGDQLPPWASSEFGIGHGDLGDFGTEAASMAVPSSEHEAWIATEYNDLPDASAGEAARERVPASSPAEPSLSSFVDISDVCANTSSSVDDAHGSHDHPPAAMAVAPAQAQLRNNGGYDIAYPDRGTVISRYKEKRKNRRFGKHIRYESRKARADGRLRIKGRFAKSS